MFRFYSKVTSYCYIPNLFSSCFPFYPLRLSHSLIWHLCWYRLISWLIYYNIIFLTSLFPKKSNLREWSHSLPGFSDFLICTAILWRYLRSFMCFIQLLSLQSKYLFSLFFDLFYSHYFSFAGISLHAWFTGWIKGFFHYSQLQLYHPLKLGPQNKLLYSFQRAVSLQILLNYLWVYIDGRIAQWLIGAFY